MELDTKTKAAIQVLIAQRNQALDQVASLAGEIEGLKEELAGLKEELAALKPKDDA